VLYVLVRAAIAATAVQRIDICPGCGKPAHASETDDRGRCEHCQLSPEFP